MSDLIERLHTECQHREYNLLGEAADEIKRLRWENDRLQKAHDHQYEMAGLMLREAERYGRELDEARTLLREARQEIGIWLSDTAEMNVRIDAFLAKEQP